MEDYEAIPYLGYPIPSAHPRRIAWTSFVHGGPEPDLARPRVLEIGCGDGAHLLSLAAHEPDWRLHGCDASPRALATATAARTQLGFSSVTFEPSDILDLSVEAEAWDFVILHGVYSWVDAPRRAALLKILGRALAPNGLAYLNFNALPGWGVRGRVRDILLRAPDEERADVIATLRPLASGDHWGSLLKHELDLAAAARFDYLMHEYYATENEAFWLGDVLSDAAAVCLRWVGDSQFDLPDGRPYEITKAALGRSDIRGEELADLALYRQMRCAVLARADAPTRAPATDAEILAGSLVYGAIRPTTETFRLGADREETMRSAGGMEIQVTEPLGKMALLELARIHPDALSPAHLEIRARTALEPHGVVPGPEEPRLLAEGLIRLWRAGALELRRHRPELRRQPAGPPRVSPYTRWEAETRPALSTPIGTLLMLSAGDRDHVRRMDGSTAPPAPLVEQLAAWGLLA